MTDFVLLVNGTEEEAASNVLRHAVSIVMASQRVQAENILVVTPTLIITTPGVTMFVQHDVSRGLKCACDQIVELQSEAKESEAKQPATVFVYIVAHADPERLYLGYNSTGAPVVVSPSVLWQQLDRFVGDRFTVFECCNRSGFNNDGGRSSSTDIYTSCLAAPSYMANEDVQPAPAGITLAKDFADSSALNGDFASWCVSVATKLKTQIAQCFPGRALKQHLHFHTRNREGALRVLRACNCSSSDAAPADSSPSDRELACITHNLACLHSSGPALRQSATAELSQTSNNDKADVDTTSPWCIRKEAYRDDPATREFATKAASALRAELKEGTYTETDAEALLKDNPVFLNDPTAPVGLYFGRGEADILKAIYHSPTEKAVEAIMERIRCAVAWLNLFHGEGLLPALIERHSKQLLGTARVMAAEALVRSVQKDNGWKYFSALLYCASAEELERLAQKHGIVLPPPREKKDREESACPCPRDCRSGL